MQCKSLWIKASDKCNGKGGGAPSPGCHTLQQPVFLYDCLTYFAKNKTFLKTKSEFVSYADESVKIALTIWRQKWDSLDVASGPESGW